jgi:hypothetical protein
MVGTAVELEGVVVTALGIKNLKLSNFATQVVNNEELTQAANPNVVQSLVGKVSGLQINKSSNGVNGTSRIVLRGQDQLRVTTKHWLLSTTRYLHQRCYNNYHLN